MAEALIDSPDSALEAEPEIRRRRGISPIWAVPIVAAIVAAWLGYTAYAEKGPEIAISFKTASGIEPGKTRIKYHDIELGVVSHVDPSPDLQNVVVTAQMNKRAAGHLRTGTSFWVVRPRFSLTGLSGLETLVSGAYVEMDPGEGDKTASFQGREEPPVVRAEVPGTEYVLTTNRLGSIGPGSPIFFRGIQVGEVMSYTFAGIEEGIAVRVFVRSPYDSFIYDDTRFWNASGISLSTGGSGFKVEVESLQALLTGGIVFDTAEEARQGERSKEGASFPLYDDRSQADDATYTRSVRVLVDFGGSIKGLDVGAPVEFRGMKIGKVVAFHLEFDTDTQKFHVPVTLAVQFDRLHVVGHDLSRIGSGAYMDDFVARGMRAQLRSASLITGQMVVALDFFPDAPPAVVDTTGPYPKLPSLPNEMENITRSVSETLDKVAALPLDAVVQDVRTLLASLNGIAGSPELKATVKSANDTMVQAERLMRETSGQVGPLVTSLRKTSDAADAALRQVDSAVASMNSGYGRDSKLRGEMSEMLRQVEEMARSFRVLAAYLEQHPDALLRGKSGGPR